MKNVLIIIFLVFVNILMAQEPVIYDSGDVFYSESENLKSDVLFLKSTTTSMNLTTTFASDNNFDGNMFDIDVKGFGIDIFGMDINASSTIGAVDVYLYYKEGTFVGSETNASAWTLFQTFTNITASGVNLPTHLDVSELTLKAGTTYGIYVTVGEQGATVNDNSAVRINYTNGTANYENSDIKINYGVGIGGLFGSLAGAGSGVFPPRTWNGTVYYEYDCPDDIEVDNDPGVCGAVVDYDTPPGTPGLNNLPSGSIFPVGVTTNTFTDPECTFSVTVNDVEAPVIECLEDIVVANDPGVCCAVVEFPENGIETGTAEPGITLEHQGGNMSGVAYNPALDLYYSVRAGNVSFPIYTYDGDGNLLTTNQAGFETRGLWWNPNTTSLEGNSGFGQGYHIFYLDASGYALSTGTTDPTSNFQPDVQSEADYDYDADEVLYYYNGSVYRTSRTTGGLLGSYVITGLPAITLNWTFVGYTGFPGAEIMVYDYDNKIVYLVDKTTGVYSKSVQLPGDAPGQSYLNTSYSNGHIWINNAGYDDPGEWVSYKILDSYATDNCGIASIEFSPASGTCFPVGETEVTMTVTDVNDNESECTFMVTVNDEEPPTAVCQPFTVQLDLEGDASIEPDDIDGGSGDNCEFELSADPVDFTCDEVGDNTVTLTVTDASGNTDECTATVAVIERPTVLTYTGDLDEQYSDQADLSATLVDELTGTPLEGFTLTFEIGTQSTTGVTDEFGVATATLILTQNPCEEYTVKVTSEHICPFLSTEVEKVFDITPEDVEVAYIGVLFEATPGPGENTAVVKLMATVREVDDGSPGDISLAKVSFVDREGSDIKECIPVEYFVDPLDPTTGVVTYDWSVTINGNDNSVVTQLGTLVGLPSCADCYYQRDDASDDVVVVVYEPVGDFITGGGFIMPELSAGPYASDVGSKANYGFNVKYNKKGTRLQGKFTMIVRSDGRVYQIKSNAIESLGVNIADPDKDVAVFTSKANLKDVTDEFSNSGEGNLILKVNITDRGEPGVDDEIGISLWSAVKVDGQWTADELLYSSEWDGLQTLEQYIAGGNLVVHSGFNTEPEPTAEAPKGKNKSAIIPENSFNVYPNPFSDRLFFEFSREDATNATLDLYDAVGRKLELLFDQRIEAKQTYRVEYNPNGLSTNMLFYRITFDNEVINGKMIYRE